MIYSAVKNYERAMYFFEVVVSTPALAMSHIMLESYKKYILVSLILHGKVRADWGISTEIDKMYDDFWPFHLSHRWFKYQNMHHKS